MRETQRHVSYDQMDEQTPFPGGWHNRRCVVAHLKQSDIWSIDVGCVLEWDTGGDFFEKLFSFFLCLKLCIFDGSRADPINIQMEIWALHHSLPYSFIMSFLASHSQFNLLFFVLFLFFFKQMLQWFLMVVGISCRSYPDVTLLNSTDCTWSHNLSFCFTPEKVATCSLKASKIPSEVLKIYLLHNSSGDHLSNRSVCWVIHDSKHGDRDELEWMRRLEREKAAGIRWTDMRGWQRRRSENDSGIVLKSQMEYM